jgi:succinate dehydrogenase hydrophobic anchor subunit
MIKGKMKTMHDRWFLIVSAVLTVALTALSIYSIIFLSNNLLTALSNKTDDAQEIRFNLDKYQELSRKLKLEQ